MKELLDTNHSVAASENPRVLLRGWNQDLGLIAMLVFMLDKSFTETSLIW